jgi:hypothetical protein
MRRSTLVAVCAAVLLVAAGVGISWLVDANHPASPTGNGPQQAPPVSLFALPQSINGSHNSSIGCPISLNGTETCYLFRLYISGPSLVTTTVIQSLFIESPTGGEERDVTATLATDCSFTNETFANGTSIPLSASCDQGVAYFTNSGGWVECAVSLCGGANADSAVAPPVPLSDSEVVIVPAEGPNMADWQLVTEFSGANGGEVTTTL